jgi:hypothetical protein
MNLSTRTIACLALLGVVAVSVCGLTLAKGSDWPTALLAAGGSLVPLLGILFPRRGPGSGDDHQFGSPPSQ